jgi:hypothetical protein
MIKHKEFDQQSGEWFRLKLGKVGGTAMKKLMSSSNLDLIDELIAQEGSGLHEETYTSAAMQRGIDLEPMVRKLFIKVHPEIKIKEVGLLISEQYPEICCSPDGITDCDTVSIEIKCPSTKKHVQYIRQGGIMSEYKYQVLNYFFVNPKLERLFCISFDDRYKPKPYCEYLVKREDVAADLVVLEDAVQKFIKKLNEYKSKINK